MGSGKQKRQKIKLVRKAKADKLVHGYSQAKPVKVPRVPPPGHVHVNVAALAPDGSYDIPRFVQRGTYCDVPFNCMDCGKRDVWRATQQKWWYEVAKGNVWTTATRCRPCRAKERARKNEARRVHQEGLAAKAAARGKSAK